jgi:tetratricopeptide (TPR) repeat protein
MSRHVPALLLTACLAFLPRLALAQDACFGPPPGGDLAPQIAACSDTIAAAKNDKEMQAHAYFMRAHAYDHEGQNARAISDFTQMLALMPDNIPARVNRGNVYAHARDYAKAVADFDAVIAVSPDLAVAWAERGMAYDGMGASDKAIADDSKALTLGPQLADNILNNRGLAYAHQGDYAHAIADEDQAIKINAGLADAWANRCFARAAWGKELDKGVADCNKSLSLEPNNPSALDRRGLIELRQGQWTRAIADFNAALLADPGLNDAMYGRGLARQHNHDTMAAGDLKTASASDPGVAAMYARFGIR